MTKKPASLQQDASKGQFSPAGTTPLEEARPSADFVVWPFEQAAWSRIQTAVGHRAEGEADAVWLWIDQGLLLTSMEQQRKSMPSLKEIRSDKQRFLRDIDSLIESLGSNTSPSATELFQLGGQAFDWLMEGAMRKLHPTGPPRSKNARRGRVPFSQPLPPDPDEVQLAAQKQVLALFRQLSPSLGLLREFVAESLVETSMAQSRGPGLDLTKLTFVNYTAIAYEVAYRRPARPGRKGASDEAGPAVRFIAGVAKEARRANTIEPHYHALLKLGLHVTPNAIRRLLAKRQA